MVHEYSQPPSDSIVASPPAFKIDALAPINRELARLCVPRPAVYPSVWRVIRIVFEVPRSWRRLGVKLVRANCDIVEFAQNRHADSDQQQHANDESSGLADPARPTTFRPTAVSGVHFCICCRRFCRFVDRHDVGSITLEFIASTMAGQRCRRNDSLLGWVPLSVCQLTHCILFAAVICHESKLRLEVMDNYLRELSQSARHRPYAKHGPPQRFRLSISAGAVYPLPVSACGTEIQLFRMDPPGWSTHSRF